MSLACLPCCVKSTGVFGIRSAVSATVISFDDVVVLVAVVVIKKNVPCLQT